MIKLLRNSVLVLLAALPLFASAAQTATEVVETATNTLLADLKANKEQYRANPDEFYAALNRILLPVVDVEGISRGVMTVRFSRKATPEQMTRFEENFKRSLMQFYGNALLEYNNENVRVLPESGKPGADRASVNMEITGSGGAVYPLTYTMVRKNNTWVMRNLIINGINVGKLFRDQFAEQMQAKNNDLDKVIDSWADVVAKARNAKGDA